MTTDIGNFIDRNSPMLISDAIQFLTNFAHALETLHDGGRVWDLQEESILVSDEYAVSITGSIDLNDDLVASVGDSIEEQILLAIIPPETGATGKHSSLGDIYAWGHIGFELIVGSSPFRASTVLEAMKARLAHKIESPSALRLECPEKLGFIILKALAKDPTERYLTIKEVYDDLQMAT